MRGTLLVILAVGAGGIGACDARSLVPDGGGGAGTGGSVCLGCGGAELLSDFEDLSLATIVKVGNPPRNGYWYSYNDESGGRCLQDPLPGMPYLPAAPPSPSWGPSGSLALHTRWMGCTTWGAAIGADINNPVSPDGGVYMGPKVPYDLTPFTGVMFWAMATPGAEVQLRVKLPMRANTRTSDGGACDEAVLGADKCNDDFGERFDLPANGNWKQVTVRFSDATFAQEGWGAVYAWDPTDVTSIQIQSVVLAATYDFWIDDVYLLR